MAAPGTADAAWPGVPEVHPTDMRKALLIDLYALDAYDISLATGYLKASADADPDVRSAWEISLLHLATRTPAPEVADAVMKSGAELVGFSCYSWNIRQVERAIALLPVKDRPIVVLGGIEVTPDPVGYLRRDRNADVVVFGEGEETFRELLARLKDVRPGGIDRVAVGGIAGVAWRDGAELRANKARSAIPDLAGVPSPYLAGTYGELLANQDRVMVETARGCPYTCTFCFEPRGFARVRSFPMARVKAELDHVVAAGVREVAFLDTNFNMDRKRAVEVWNHLHGLGRRVRYAFELRGELIDEVQAKSLSQLDYFAEIGLQSVNADVLKRVKRWYEPDKFRDGLTYLLNAGIYRPCSYSAHGGVAVDVMMGLPGETVADVLFTFDFVFALAPSTIVVSMTKLLPGTELYDDVEKYQYDFDPDDQYVMRSSSGITKPEARDLMRFSEAADFAYNRLHAVRTIGWLAERLGTTPSSIFLELGRRLAKSKKPSSEMTLQDLSDLLARICRDRGRGDLAGQAESKLAREGVLNLLQGLRESKRTAWSNALFRVGHRVLRWMGLPPLPKPLAADARPHAPTDVAEPLAV